MKPRHPIRILIVESSFLTRIALRSLLQSDPGLAIVAEANDGEMGIESYCRVHPDVTIVGMRPNGLDVVELLNKIRSESPCAPLLFVTARAVTPAKDARDDGIVYLPEDSDGEQLREAILSLTGTMRT